MGNRSVLFSRFFLVLIASIVLTACGGSSSSGGGGGGGLTGPGTLQFSAATYSGSEDSGDITVTVTRTGGSDGTVTVDLADALTGTATEGAGNDYTVTGAGTLTWADGDSTAQTVTITPNADITDEPDETVDLTLSNITGGATLGTAAATVAILNDDSAGTLSFSAATYSGNEDDGAITVTVTRTNGNAGMVTVDLADALTGSATEGVGNDYTVTGAGTLTWNDGENTIYTITIDPVADNTFESDETVDLTLSGITGGATLGTAAATVTITNDDVPGTLSFSAATYSGNEDDGAITVTVTRTGGSDGTVSVDLADALTGTATEGAGNDYTVTGAGTLTWNHGDATDKTITINPVADNVLESDETVDLTLSGITGGATLGTAAATVTITNDDVPGTLQFSAATYSGNEDDGAITVTVTRTGGSDGTVTVDLADALTGTATEGAGNDYTVTGAGTLTWSHGDATAKTITVNPVADNVFEANETVNLTLSTVTGGATLGTAAATVTITNDDNPGTLQFSSATYSGNEDDGAITVTVTRTGGSDGTATVDVSDALSGTATSGADYTVAGTGTLTWLNGDTTPQTVTITPVADTTIEPDETVNLTLTNFSAGVSAGISAATVTILNDDGPGTLSFSAAAYSGNEDAGAITVTVTRTGGSSGTVTVDVSDALTGTATEGAGNDYTVTGAGTLTWNDGDSTAQTITINPVADATNEPDETVDLTLTNFTGGATQGTTAATVTILNDDFNPGVLQFDSSSYSFDEFAGTVSINVTRTSGTDGIVTVDYSDMGTGTATAGADYTVGGTSTLTWGDGVGGTQTITVNINDDTDVETDETIDLQLSNPTGSATIGALNTTTVTINWDDTNLTMDIGDGTYWVAFRDGPSGTWTKWDPSTGNTYEFPVTDAFERYGVAFHKTESRFGSTAEKVYVIHATVSEMSSFDAYNLTKYTVSGTLSNYTGTNDNACAAISIKDGCGADAYAYSLSGINEGPRDFFAWEEDSVAGGLPENVYIDRDHNITGDTTINVDFSAAGPVPLTATLNTFSSGCGGCLLRAYWASANGTSLELGDPEVTPHEFPRLTNSGFMQAGDAYSFQVYAGNWSKVRIRNEVATSDPGNPSYGFGSTLTDMTGATVNTTQTMGLSYTPAATGFSGNGVFRAFAISLDQTLYGGPHWQIDISKGWLNATGATSYTHPDFLGDSVAGFDPGWDLMTSFSVDPTVSALTTNPGTGLKLILKKSIGYTSNNLGNPLDWAIWWKMSTSDSLKLDIANQIDSSFTW